MLDGDWEVAKGDEDTPESKLWNPQEELAKVKQNILNRIEYGQLSHDDASKTYLAHKLLLTYPRMNRETYDKHITSVLKDLHNPSGKIIDNSHLLFTPNTLRLNRNNINSDFLKNYFNAKKEKKQRVKTEEIYKHPFNIASKTGYAPLFTHYSHVALLNSLKQYYKLRPHQFSGPQKVSDMLKHAKQDTGHPLYSKENAQEVFKDIINILKASKSQTSSKKPGISFRNKYKIK